MNTEHKVYLDALREIEKTNMFASAPYIISKFGLGKNEARSILSAWMKSY